MSHERKSMALELWAEAQERKGNIYAVRQAILLVQQYGDVVLTNGLMAEPVLSTEQLIASEKEALERFFGKRISVPEIPQEALGTLSRAHELGWTKAELHYLPKLTLKQKDKFPGWKQKPEDWFWKQIGKGTVNKDAARLPGAWVLVDSTQKPNYNEQQMYENDPFIQVLANLRKEAKIQQRDHVPDGSRFDISADELYLHVLPAIAKFLGVDKGSVRLPKEIEFNVLSNLYYPEWGQTNTGEWHHDKFQNNYRLRGGYLVRGGLAPTPYDWSDKRYGSLGFRPLVIFSPK